MSNFLCRALVTLLLQSQTILAIAHLAVLLSLYLAYGCNFNFYITAESITKKEANMILNVDTELELKQLELSDATDIFTTIDNQREYLGKWLPFVALTNNLSDSENFVSSVVNASEDAFEYVFTIRKQNTFVGIIGFKDTDKQNKKTEIGYWLSENAQKQGIVTKSVDTLCDFAFNRQGINRIQIKCAAGNIPSKNIPQKLGFRFEGIERQGELLTGTIYTDLEIYSKLKSEYISHGI
jgi:ribosomal-protein-serine acetyltransferase